MKATFAQYLRVQNLAGGSSASNRRIIKAAHTRLSNAGKAYDARIARHAWLRSLLAIHNR